MKQYVLDSYALIAFFENEEGAQRVEEILKEMAAGKNNGLTTRFKYVINDNMLSSGIKL